MKTIKPIKFRKSNFKKSKPLSLSNSSIDFLPLFDITETDKVLSSLILSKTDLLLYKEPNTLRLINTTQNEQIILMDYHPNPSQISLHTISDQSSVYDVIQALLLEDYKLVNLPNLKYGLSWFNALEPLYIEEMQSSYSNPIYPLTRFRNLPLPDRLKVALRSI